MDEVSLNKRILISTENNNGPVKEESKKVLLKSKQVEPTRCTKCKQYEDQIVFYGGHQNNSCEEIITLSRSDLLLFTGEEADIMDGDEIPNVKVTYFSIYDEKGHLCAFDTGLIEKNVPLYLSGYVKPIYTENPSPDDGFPTHDIGPINVWWTSGFDGGEKVLVTLGTQYAEYYLMEPSKEYEPFWKSINDKVMVWKLTIEFLLDECMNSPSYEDLLQHLEASAKLEQPEETLLKNAQFVCDQVINYYEDPPEDEPPLISLPCMRALIKLSGTTLKGVRKTRTALNKMIKKKSAFTKATTTKLVKSLFENIFPDQLENENEQKTLKRKRCGVCEACQSPDCGRCSNCKDMLKFGGSGKSKQACKLRKCPYMAIQEAEESENEDEDKEVLQNQKHKTVSKRSLYKVEWLDKSDHQGTYRQFYDSAKVGDNVIKTGDFVMLNSEDPSEPLLIAKVEFMFETAIKTKMFHAHLFCRGSDTVLGETSDPRELFAINYCEDCPLGTVVRKAEVEFRKPPENWAELGGVLDLPPQLEDDGHSFFINKCYDREKSRFVDIVDNPYATERDYKCKACKLSSDEKNFDIPSYIDDETIEWRNEIFTVGTAVFLSPIIYSFRKEENLESEGEPQSVDDDMYPEYFRKKSDKIKGSNEDTVKPFIIGVIVEIKKGKNFPIKVRLFCRPTDTLFAMFLAYKKDLNLIYWTDTVINSEFENVFGKCYVSYGDLIENVDEWSITGPYRFYFTEKYDFKNHKFSEVPPEAAKLGYSGKGKGKGKVKSTKPQIKSECIIPEWESIDRPLRCMDVFAGCGGLTEGLHQAGIADTKWAIERDKAAAHAFKINYPDCKVFIDDCNDILRQVITGEGKNKGFPEKGEVELMVGGPPCQGFSGMNRFNASQYSLFKSSLIVSYLSFCEYYRPKYFILENVRNFVSFKKNMVLKLTVRCLLAMGYQVTFGVLQAGHYGIPQTRRRLIIMAAAPGYVLPKYPEPQHVFNKRGCQLSFTVGNQRFYNGNLWIESAPYRTISVRDAISDLPDIKNGSSKLEIPYDSDPVSHFQKMMRKNNNSEMVMDHICKEMSAIVEGRIIQIPTYPGADWRDLPNIVTRLSDGTMTNKLRYPYVKKSNSKKQPPKKGVCVCVTGKPCDPTDRQNNTLIPWCLPHTADRHNHWSGLYGRLEWDGFFGTTITNPEPMGKQGRVLHPEQHRVVSVRECARSQGFPDKFKFYGNILDKHRQVGNAVPPPLGCAIGREIRKAYAQTTISPKIETNSESTST